MILWNRSINDNLRWRNRVKYIPKNPGTGEYWTLTVTQVITDGADCYPWRKTFALWPVKTIGNKYVWLRRIYKRKVWVVWGTGFHMEPHVEYAELFDILNNP